MSSVIKELAKSTGTKYPCRAKNPATCRVHGTFNPVALINDSGAAKRNLRASELAKKNASTLEDRIEAEMLTDKDQLIYDATGVGLEALRSAVRSAGDKLTKTEAEIRLETALAYREELLKDNPAVTAIDAHYNRVISQPGAVTYGLDEKGRMDEETFTALHAVPYGTPVALKLRSGGYVYDRAGDGIIGGYDNLSRFQKLGLKARGFVSKPSSWDDQRAVTVTLINSSGNNGKRFESITVLPADSNPLATSPLENVETTDYDLDGSGYRAVLGKDFAYIGDMQPYTYTYGDRNGTRERHWSLQDVSVHPGSTGAKVLNVKLA